MPTNELNDHQIITNVHNLQLEIIIDLNLYMNEMF